MAHYGLTHWEQNEVTDFCFADDTFESIFFKGNVGILIQVALKFVAEGPIKY